MHRSSSSGWFRRNGLTLVLSLLFLVTYLGGQLFTGIKVYNQEREERGQEPLSIGQYLSSAHFGEISSENWESEFLQMFVYVCITTVLFQKGSAESNDPDKPEEKRAVTSRSPWPVRRGGLWRRIYEHSLSLAFAFLFLLSFFVHLWSSTRLENEERAQQGESLVTTGEHAGSAKFWFESFQNWQSEFLSIGAMVVLSIYLREKNSPESKAVEASHEETGG